MKTPARILIIAIALCILLPCCYSQGQSETKKLPVITVARDATVAEELAAREVQRYVYLRTGSLPPISGTNSEGDGAIVIGLKGRQIVMDAAKKAGISDDVNALGPQEYAIRTFDTDGKRNVLIAGGDDCGTLYGAYSFAEHLGVRFYLHGDVIPDGRMSLKWPEMNDRGKPLFELRGIQPFHDFPEGPDWWDSDDYKAIISQLPKLRMNFIGLHTYPEGGPNAEPTVWIGLPEDVNDDGTVKFSYPASYYNTQRGTWGYRPKKTSEYSYGSPMLYDRDYYGPDVMRDATPQPSSLEMRNTVFDKTGKMLNEAFEYAHLLGVKTCVGTETPLTVPRELKQHLREKGKNPDDPKVIGELYEGILKRCAEAYPIDYYWLWTPEWWLGEVADDHVKKTVADMQSAVEAAKKMNSPFRIATCGWVLGPQSDRSMWDKVLPKDVPVSCINRGVGMVPVDPAFMFAKDREKWAIPWLEDDPALTAPQLWAGRMRKDAADALEYGCTGLMGIHWRTRALAPNVLALARAAWDQSGWKEVKRVSGAIGGSAAGPSPRPIDGTDDDTLYQTVRWGVPMYRLFLPDGKYTVTLKFAEFTFSKEKARVFDVTIQGKKVIDDLDITAKAGFDQALDFTFDGIEAVNGCIEVGFVAKRDAPAIAAISIEGAKGGIKINCGGPEYKDYSRDVQLFTVTTTSDDLYLDWATAEFGEESAKEIAEVFTKMDCRLPRPCGWVGGPGGIGGNPNPWDEAVKDYSFVDELEALRPGVKGTGNIERFDYWLNTFRYMKSIAHLECILSEFDRALEEAEKAENADEKKRIARESALPKRKEMMAVLAEMYGYMLATVTTPGEMGTVTNWEQHIFPSLIDERGRKLAGFVGEELPADAVPSREYTGPERLIVPTNRTSILEGENLEIEVMVLGTKPVKSLRVLWRELGKGDYSAVELEHNARGVYSASVPSGGFTGTAFEYYVEAKTASGEVLHCPATAPEMNVSVVVIPAK